MKVLIACEFSGIVREAFSARGYDAWSCDLLDTEIPGQHIKGDVLEILNDGWDMIISFPPCTHLAVSGALHFGKKRNNGLQKAAIDFFMCMIDAPADKIAVENPVGIMSTEYRKPDQIIQPYYFGDSAQKTTCLWLRNLPPLFHANEKDLFNDKITHVGAGEFMTYKNGTRVSKTILGLSPGPERAKIRSKIFPGIAEAMAKQWG